LILSGYSFVLFKDYIQSKKYLDKSSCIILRHDVDSLPYNSLRIAVIENSFGIKSSYYFRIEQERHEVEILKKIAALGNEIGYHYEDVNLVLKCNKQMLKEQNGHNSHERLIDLAYESFCKNLERMRKIYPIKTICAHGSPLSPFDNKIMWNKYDYKKLGIIGEPYFDIDWDKFAYFTDTGRRWNGYNVSLRDKVNSKYKFNFKSTIDIMNNISKLPSHLMITVHPQRWNSNITMWAKELIMQSGKNINKKYLYIKNERIHAADQNFNINNG
jgi:hypothetical protein